MFHASQLSVLAYANNFTLWHYNGENINLADVPANFFDKAHSMLRPRDRIIFAAKDQVRDFTVTNNANMQVTVWLPGVVGEGFAQENTTSAAGDSAQGEGEAAAHPEQQAAA